MLQEQRRAGGGRAGTRAANGAGRTPASERDVSWLDPQVGCPDAEVRPRNTVHTAGATPGARRRL
ncbi:hypothetical protein J1605_000734 [Eschrichtius robustus]|uniref:Uncharacterized protein n=1 Tax=Eschrichtius robustus TaxID=9764 RepID=A0AB34GM99_ESCRO|nr:hypothetical protein J1605_000734 [Eschrichtius robustus]